ncbi:MAG: hypothetical protein GX963_02740 [Bacteroidales bacterium]|nr:hypothetical protein [Bacteroidales bacterium]
MKNDLLNSFQKAIRYWWISMIVGIIAAILGVWCLFQPMITLVTLSVLFVVGFIIGGVFEIVFAIANKEGMRGWGWTLASGIISVLFGLLLLSKPITTLAAMLFFVGFWLMFQSLWSIGTSVDLQMMKIKGWGWLLTFGVLGLILSFFLILNPTFAAGFIVYLMSLTLFCYGLIRVFFGVKLRSLNKRIKELES